VISATVIDRTASLITATLTMQPPYRARVMAILTVAGLSLSACGGGGGGGTLGPTPISPTPPVTPAPVLPANPISAASPVAAGCTGGSSSGTLHFNAEVEPFVAVHPTYPNLMISAWQQDRWSNGGARALMTAVSVDGGTNWVRRLMPFSRCGGAGTGSSGDFERASDPWVDIGPTGVMYSMALAFNGGTLAFLPQPVILLAAAGQ